MERRRLSIEPEPKIAKKRPSGGNYFPASTLKFIPSGCALLDLVLGGGWPLGRIANVVGDKAVGKTLLAIEAMANFAQLYPKGHIWYREAEAAFDESYASTLGLPVDQVDYGPEGPGTLWETVEDIFDDLGQCIKQATKSGQPGLYIVDSLDALTTEAEIKRKVGEGSYSLEKPKLLGQLFRRYSRLLNATKICVIFISQVRDRIGITFGEKYTRSGGKALDFYASQILWLSHLGALHKTVGGVKRATAIRVRAKCKKNKIAVPLRECEFTLRFNYGIDEIEACLDYLAEVGQLSRLGLKEEGLPRYLSETAKLPNEEWAARRAQVLAEVTAAWTEVEGRFLPARRKYTQG